MIQFLVLVVLPLTYASFCGESSIPFSIEILPNGQPVLGCARPACFGWNESGNPTTNDANFFKVGNNDDGFFRPGLSSVEPYDPTDLKHYRMSKADCSEQFDSPNCDFSYQWVSGLAPQTNLSLPLKLRCCSIEPLIRSVDRGVATLRAGQIVIGGEVTKQGKQVAFDYIADVARVTNEEDGQTIYDVAVRRFECLPIFTKGYVSRDVSSKFDGARRLALQAPTYESPDNAISLPSAQQQNPSQPVIEGPFTEDEVSFPGLVHEKSAATGNEMSAAATDYLNNNSAYKGQYQQVIPPPPPSDTLLANSYASNQPAYVAPAQPSYVAPPQPAYVPAPPQAPPQPPVQYYSAPAAQPYYPSTSSYYCFSGDTQVLLLSGETKRMDELRVHDWVQQFGKSSVSYSPVTMWLHRMPEELAEFIVISLTDGTKLKITDKHFIYKTACDQSRLANVTSVPMKPVFADEVQVGDCLYKVVKNYPSLVRKVRVAAIGKVSEKGIYAPMTTTSTITVNGILASCHSVYKPSNAVTTSYFKQMSNIRDYFFGKSSEDEMELPVTLSLAIEMLHLILPKSLLFAL
ncbi:unnamed protein product [Auanema sp. JU1783]|nr:unnamed protein product [Auanema sp. JU1783]